MCHELGAKLRDIRSHKSDLLQAPIDVCQVPGQAQALCNLDRWRKEGAIKATAPQKGLERASDHGYFNKKSPWLHMALPDCFKYKKMGLGTVANKVQGSRSSTTEWGKAINKHPCPDLALTFWSPIQHLLLYLFAFPFLGGGCLQPRSRASQPASRAWWAACRSGQSQHSTEQSIRKICCWEGESATTKTPPGFHFRLFSHPSIMTWSTRFVSLKEDWALVKGMDITNRLCPAAS